GGGRYAVAKVVLTRDEWQRDICKRNRQKYVEAQGQRFIGWRRVPTDAKKADIGATAVAGEPIIELMFVAAADGLDRSSFCRQLYLVRKQAFHELKNHDLKERHVYYVASFSTRIIIYKGQLTSKQVVPYFPDLA